MRLDEEAERALGLLEARGTSRSEAIRAAIVTEARRLRTRRSLTGEVASLEADETDRAEMQAVAAVMKQLLP